MAVLSLPTFGTRANGAVHQARGFLISCPLDCSALGAPLLFSGEGARCPLLVSRCVLLVSFHHAASDAARMRWMSSAGRGGRAVTRAGVLCASARSACPAADGFSWITVTCAPLRSDRFLQRGFGSSVFADVFLVCSVFSDYREEGNAFTKCSAINDSWLVSARSTLTVAFVPSTSHHFCPFSLGCLS